MKVSELPPDVMVAILERGIGFGLDSDISADRAFDEYCNWHGLIGWGAKLRRVFGSLGIIESETDSVPSQ